MRAQPTELDRLLCNIRACRTCVESPEGKPLPHEPRPVLRVSPTARIAVCSQAPGTRVHASGIPFTDSSGDRLRDWMGVGPREFYDESRLAIIPMGFCFPGQDAQGADLPPRVRMRKDLASFFVRAAATARTCALRRVIFTAVASWGRSGEQPAGDHARLAQASAEDDAAPHPAASSSVLAQQCVAEAQSLVRGGIAASSPQRGPQAPLNAPVEKTSCSGRRIFY